MGPQATDRVAAVILAGGRGERLGGVVKAELRVGGVRLFDRVLPVMAGCGPIMVAHGPHDPARLELPDGVVPVPDLPGDYAGPLAGFAAAVAAIGDEAELLVCAAVDAPFLPADYVSRLVAGLSDAPAAIASHGGQPYPTNSIWRLAHFRDLPARVRARTAPHSLKSLAAAAGAVTVEWPVDDDGDPFANVNTPEDLALAELRLASSTAGF
jgi:molybdopterin-guanine dinucleotide biosynthesis protein A